MFNLQFTREKKQYYAVVYAFSLVILVLPGCSNEVLFKYFEYTGIKEATNKLEMSVDLIPVWGRVEKKREKGSPYTLVTRVRPTSDNSG